MYLFGEYGVPGVDGDDWQFVEAASVRDGHRQHFRGRGWVGDDENGHLQHGVLPHNFTTQERAVLAFDFFENAMQLFLSKSC